MSKPTIEQFKAMDDMERGQALLDYPELENDIREWSSVEGQ